MWKGWVRYADTLTLNGICRSLYRYFDNDGFKWIGVGTSSRFYAVSDDINYEVTPLRKTTDPLGSDPVSVTDTLTTVEITDTSHGGYTGDSVILSGLTATGGVPAGDLNTEHVITYVDDNTFSIVVDTAATSSTTGGGASGVAKYILNPGTEDQVEGAGWGSLSWSEEEWGGDPTLAIGDQIAQWSQDNWGEDLVVCNYKADIYYWDSSSPSNRMLALADLGGADGNEPTVATFIIMSHRDRHLLAFGTNAYSTSTYTPLNIRWCDQEDITKWDESSLTETSGSLLATHGSEWICGIRARDEIIAWTDSAMYAVQYIGAPLIFGLEILAQNTDIVGLNAAVYQNDVVYWIGRSGFYAYTGRVEPIPCPVWDYVERDINWDQPKKIFCSTFKLHDEIIWFYASTDGTENDKYVSYNYVENAWTIGSLTRTAWLDSSSQDNPIATCGSSNFMIEHEVGYKNGLDDTALDAYIESTPIELSSEGSFDKGDRMMFVRRIFPDITFLDADDGINTPAATMTLKMMDKPGGGFNAKTDGGSVARTATSPIETYTDEIHTRLRGRSLTFRVESTSKGTRWRIGRPRVDVRTDGQR